MPFVVFMVLFVIILLTWPDEPTVPSVSVNGHPYVCDHTSETTWTCHP